MKQQTEGAFQHLDGLGVAQSFAVQPCQVVTKAGVLSRPASPVGLADNLVAFLNEHWIDLPTVGDVEKALPALDN